MKLYDISKELFEAETFPGDPVPSSMKHYDMNNGDMCNLSVLHMGAHNGTHMDAANHFYINGKKIDEVQLENVIGKCTVKEYQGEITREAAKEIMSCKSNKKILLKGNAVMTPEAAKIMCEQGLELIGVESQTVGAMDHPADAHLALLKYNMVILEGLVLEHIPEGEYILLAQPLKIHGFEAAPCRAVLMDWD